LTPQVNAFYFPIILIATICIKKGKNPGYTCLILSLNKNVI